MLKIRIQFNTSIRILRSDNVKEYFSMTFSSFMSSYVILHQSSYAYTPQHNGVVERKNRHLVEQLALSSSIRFLNVFRRMLS